MVVNLPLFGVWIVKTTASESWNTNRQTAFAELGTNANIICPPNATTRAAELDVLTWCAGREPKAIILGGYAVDDTRFVTYQENTTVIDQGYKYAYLAMKTAWESYSGYQDGIGGFLLSTEHYRGEGGSADLVPSGVPSAAWTKPPGYNSLRNLMQALGELAPGRWCGVEGVSSSFYRTYNNPDGQTIIQAIGDLPNSLFIEKKFGWTLTGDMTTEPTAIEASWKSIMDYYRYCLYKNWIACIQTYSDSTLGIAYRYPLAAMNRQDVLTAMAYGAVGAIGYIFDTTDQTAIDGLYDDDNPSGNTYYARRSALKTAFDRGKSIYDWTRGADYIFDYCVDSRTSAGVNNIPVTWWVEDVINGAGGYADRIVVSHWKKNQFKERYLILGRDPTTDQRPKSITLRYPCHYQVEEKGIQGFGTILTVGEIARGDAVVLSLDRGNKVDIRDGIPWNMPLTIDTYDGSDQLTHPSVLFFANGVGSYRFWMAATPYPNAATYQSPCIYASKNGYTWVTPTGVTNPLYALPAGGYNAYPDLLWTANQFWMYYLEVGATTTVLRLCKSSDGITWTRQTVWTPSETIWSPSVIIRDSVFYMFYIKMAGGKYRIYYRTSVDGVTWTGSDTAITTTYLPDPFSPIGLDVLEGNGKYYMLLSAYQDTSTIRGLYILRSTDLITWQFRDTPILEASTDMFSTASIERTTGMLYGEQLIAWYGYRTSGNVWGIAAAKLKPVESYFGITAMIEELDII